MKKDYFISAGYQPNKRNLNIYKKEIYNMKTLPLLTPSQQKVEQQSVLPNVENRNIGVASKNNVSSQSVQKLEQYNNNFFTISPLTITTRQFPPAIRQWVNSIYNFNKNYMKNLPAVDNIVNKIIKSFFSINPLAYNPGGKKSRLLQRRYKRLSLNTILVSKSEIKHSNDKVYITVYLFNKKKKSLLNKLKNLYNTISLQNFSSLDDSYTSGSYNGKRALNNKYPYFMRKFLNLKLFKRERNKQKKIYRNLIGLSKIFFKGQALKTKKANSTFSFTQDISPHMQSKKSNNLNLRNVHTFLAKNHGFAHALEAKSGNTKPVNKYIKRGVTSPVMGLINYNKKVVYYKTLNNLTKNSISKFFSLALLLLKSGFTHRGCASVKQKLTSCYAKKDVAQALYILQARLGKHTQEKLALQVSNKNLQSLVNENLGLLAHSSTIKNYYYALNKYKLYRNNVGAFLAQENNLINTASNNDSVLNLVPEHNTLMYWQDVMLKIKSLKLPSVLPESLRDEKKENFNSENALSENKALHIMLKKAKNGSLKTSRSLNSMPMHKLKALYKLFTLYNNLYNVQGKPSTLLETSSTHSTNEDNFLANSAQQPNLFTSVGYTPKQQSEMQSLYSSKIVWNTYKLLKKSLILNIQSIELRNGGVKEDTLKSLTTNNSNTQTTTVQKQKNFLPLASGKRLFVWSRIKNRYISMKRLGGVAALSFSHDKLKQNKNNSRVKYFLKTSLSTTEIRKRNKSFNSIQRVMKNIILMKSINKIDRFFSKYKNLLLSAKNANIVRNSGKGLYPMDKEIISSISSVYKLNFIKEFLDKELLYLYYIKLLSFNNAIFKNWFLNSLKNIISKIYNKKVVFNLINLKYIHLNSDILLQAMKIRLRNFKKNRVTKVLRKALKLVKLSKINIYTYDIHSPVYKYITQHFNNFKSLNFDIFNHGTQHRTDLTPYYTPTKIRRLNHIQASTINFIKYKSVFGVRLQGSGRLTKRSTASRSIFKCRYKGSLKNNAVLSRTVSSVILNNNRISNLQFTKISSKTRNGSYGLKGWINNN